MADRKVIQFTGTDGNDYDVRDEAAQQMIGTTALPTTAQTLTGAIAEHETDIGTKADKVASAVNGNFAGLDGNGNLTDSGSKASDFVPVDREINGKALSADVTLTGDDITVSFEDEQTVSDAISELNTAVESKADQTQVDEIEKELTGKADKDSVFAYKEAVPGEVVEVYDAVAEAVKTMQIEIAPVQDLHGYDKPWVGGAGKNLVNVDDFTASSSNVTVTILGNEVRAVGNGESSYLNARIVMAKKEYAPGTYYVKFKVKSGATLTSFTKIAFRSSTGTINNSISIVSGTTSYSGTLTISDNCYLAIMLNGSNTGSAQATDITVYDLIVSETDVPYEPYENICPISGFTEANIIVNLLDYRKIFSEGKVLQNNILTYEMPVKNGTYTLSTNVPLQETTNNASIFVSESGTSANTTNNGVSINNPRTVTITTGKIWVHVRTTNGIIITEEDFKNGTYWVCLREGDIAPIYTITFPSGQTVYGGTLTVNADGTGTLVVDMVKASFEGVTWTANTTFPNTYDSGLPATFPRHSLIESEMSKSVSNKYTWYSSSIVGNKDAGFAMSTAGDLAFYVKDKTIATVEEANAKLNDLEIAYAMRYPVAYTLTAPQIRTILGYNRIYANTGSILSMLYPAEKYQTAEQAYRERIHAVVDEPSAVISVTDGADNVPMGMNIAIEPVQDKHGLEPYPPGGGKNLLPLTIDGLKDANTTGTWNGNDYTIRGITYSINTDSSGNILNISASGTNTSSSSVANLDIPVDLPVGDYIFNGLPDDSVVGEDYMGINVTGSSLYLRANTTGRQREFSATAEHHSGIAWLAINNGITVSNRIFYPMIRLAAEANATFVPYSNICPITGWTGAEITRTGKNLFDKDSTDNVTGKYLVASTGSLANSSSGYDTSGFIRINAEETYTASGFSVTGGTEVCFYDKSQNFISGISSSNHTFTTPENAVYLRFDYKHADLDVMQLETGITASECKVYQGTTYPVTFPSSAGTVYGGTLTVNKDGTGSLVVDRAIEEVPTLSEVTTSTFGVTYGMFLAQKAPSTSKTEIVVEFENAKGVPYNDRGQTPYVGYCTTTNTYKQMLLRAGAGTTLEQFNAMYAGSKYVYKLATPITYILPAPVIRSLLGTNNVFANTGDILRLEHCADTKLYIDNKIAELQALILENM